MLFTDACRSDSHVESSGSCRRPRNDCRSPNQETICRLWPDSMCGQSRRWANRSFVSTVIARPCLCIENYPDVGYDRTAETNQAIPFAKSAIRREDRPRRPSMIGISFRMLADNRSRLVLTILAIAVLFFLSASTVGLLVGWCMTTSAIVRHADAGPLGNGRTGTPPSTTGTPNSPAANLPGPQCRRHRLGGRPVHGVEHLAATGWTKSPRRVGGTRRRGRRRPLADEGRCRPGMSSCRTR